MADYVDTKLDALIVNVLTPTKYKELKNAGNVNENELYITDMATDEDTSYIAQQAMPSSKYVDLQLGASGTTYTAPANGWFTAVGASSTAGENWINLRNEVNQIGSQSYSSETNTELRVLCPVILGDTVKLYYANTNVHTFRFIYAQGDAE